jgi:hypothetical protein
VTAAASGMLTISVLAQRYQLLLDTPFTDLVYAEEAALEQLVLGIEPHSTDEVCTLTALAASELDALVSRNQGCSAADVRKLGQALEAICRYMARNGARDLMAS